MARDGGWTTAAPFEEDGAHESAADAEAYSQRLCTPVYFDTGETCHQLPFRAIDEGATWRVLGSRPYGWPTNPFTGPLTIVLEKATGRTVDVHFTGAPAGWDAEILRKLGRDPGPTGAK